MDKKNIIRAWKNPEYRASHAEAPESPAGAIELEDVALESIVGGRATASIYTISSGWICSATTECGC
jgi:mersacidin/lichenicidin family type 2 lantibiotic